MLSQWLVIKQLVACLITAGLMSIYFNISLKKSAILSMLYLGLVLLVDFVVYAGNRMMFSGAGEVQGGYVLAGNLVLIFDKIILFICILLIKRQFGKKSTEVLPDSWWIKFLFFPIFTVVTIAFMIAFFPYTEKQTQAQVLYAIAFGMITMNIYVYYLVNDIVNNEAKLYEKEMLEQQVKNELKMYHSISENFEMQKRQTHEFRNHILGIEALVKKNQYQDLVDYITNLSNSINYENCVIDTNHVIVNAIINAKYQEALGKQILFVFRVNDLSKIKMQNEDLVVLLANLLNNAIEACEQCKEKRIIKLKFLLREDNTVVLSVKNTFSQPLIRENNEIKTSKSSHPENHGVGIKNIVKVIEKYHGSYIIDNSKQEFYFSIFLPEIA
ncbi:MAG: GHKL domain-containing protein [Lachnospiraceae bacterium]|nr:GHKL domain-containing protein [Lachnospiraceae bacterium]